MYTVPKLDDYSPAALDKAVTDLFAALEDETAALSNEADWKGFRDRWLARKNGLLTQVNDTWLKAAPKDAKREVGQRVNELKARAETAIDAAQSRIHASSADAKLEEERLDITLPGVRRPIGGKHPVLRVQDEIVAIFKAMGYSVGEGPEVETDYYNFESLNFPPNHPARDTQDTLFIEGLAVDTNITFCDLKGTLDHAMKALFGSSVKTRFYPSFFPFTEPSADMQVSCIFCGGKGCRKCKFSGWIELLGCGMVDPNVFEFVKHNGYDPSKVSGFAFGMGVERIAILKYEVEEIQLFYEGDVRFLEQFA
jgi:phenylalanyl-tRNA synthetase alpha chain